MADEKNGSGMTSSDLQSSQAGGESGEFGGNMYQAPGNQPVGGGASEADISQAGGSSGTGGYGNAQNQANHQGQGAVQSGLAGGDLSEGGGGSGQSRGERFDDEQGGGRGPGTMARWDENGAGDSSDFKKDQQAHQDRGQSEVEFEDK
ncbi:MAG TPA: hypothetical protein VGB62_03695 [Allosphingosinicella sp.]